MRGRFFQRLQQRIERRLREHVHLVDQVDLVATACRRVLGVVDQVAHIVDAGVACRIDFEQVDKAALVDLHADAANATGLRGRPLLAIQRLGEDPRDRGLADAARAGEEEGVMDASPVQRMRQRAHDVLLPDQLGKLPGTPFARKDLIGHRDFRKAIP